MSPAERAVAAARLKVAIDEMAARYGGTCMRLAYAEVGTDKRAAADRRADRQYRALLRLTNALADQTAGGAR